jgi:hypothetical protein
LARSIGSCIVDAIESQAAIVPFLESQEEELRVNRLLDPNCATIEAMLTHCHGEDGPIRLGLGEIVATASTMMPDRRESAGLESKKMGSTVRLLDFNAVHDTKGFAIHLTPDVRRFIHKLARDHRIGDSEHVVPGCPYCSEVMSVQT